MFYNPTNFSGATYGYYKGVQLRKDQYRLIRTRAAGGNTILDLTETGGELFGDLALDTEATFATAGGTSNDINPADLQIASVLKLVPTGNSTLTGITAPNTSRGKVLLIANRGSANIVLNNNDASSTAANRFSLSGNETLNANEGALLYYDRSISRWICIAIYQ